MHFVRIELTWIGLGRERAQSQFFSFSLGFFRPYFSPFDLIDQDIPGTWLQILPLHRAPREHQFGRAETGGAAGLSDGRPIRAG
jgi:hypothetical protein